MRYINREEVEKIGLSGIHSYEIEDKTVSRILSSFWIVSHTSNKSITPHFKNDGFWEAWITLWISKNVRPGSICVDAGANYGYFTLQLALHGCSVLSIESNPKITKLLRESVKMNGFGDKVKVLTSALGDGQEVLFREYDCMNYSLKKEVSHFLGLPIDSKLIKTKKLDDLIDKCDFIKLDIEGAEELAFDGMQKILYNNPHCVVLLEFAPLLYKDGGKSFLIKLMKENDLTFVGFDGEEKKLSEWSENEFCMIVVRRKKKISLSKLLCPYQTSFPKKRYGNEYDGGYIILEGSGLPKFDKIFTFGIGDDISFELNYSEINHHDSILMFDHTVSELPVTNDFITFIKEKATSQLLYEICNELEDGNYLLKMDIEGDEYEIINNSDPRTLLYFQQIIVEFHDLWNAPLEVFQKLNEYFSLVHVHANNHGPIIDEIPQVLECTYISKKYEHSINIDLSEYPTQLDFSNKKNCEDYLLNYWK